MSNQWAQSLKVDNGINQLKNYLVCDFHFRTIDFERIEGALVLKPNSVPLEVKIEATNDQPMESESVEEPSSTNTEFPKGSIVSEWPTVLPTTSTGMSSSNNSLSLAVTERQIRKTTSAVDDDSTKQISTSPKKTMILPLHSNDKRNDQTPPTRPKLLGIGHGNKSEVSHTSSSTTSKANSTVSRPIHHHENCTPPHLIFTESPKTNEQKYEDMISEQKARLNKYITELRSHIKHNYVDKELFLRVYHHYLQIIPEVYKAEAHFINNNINYSIISKFPPYLQPIPVPDEVLEVPEPIELDGYEFDNA